VSIIESDGIAITTYYIWMVIYYDKQTIQYDIYEKSDASDIK